jgi:hypothetical protein
MTSWVLRSLATALAVALVSFALVAERTAARGARELLESDRAFDGGRLELAIQHARAAATAYVPGADHVGLGYARLSAVAHGAERARDVELAMTAWRAMRAAAIESRHLWQPHPDELWQADRQLARLRKGPESTPAGPDFAGAGAGLPLAVLGGLVLGAACAALGLLGLCGREATDAGDRPTARARLAALSCLVGVLFWSVALLHA